MPLRILPPFDVLTNAHSLNKDTTLPGGPGRSDIAVLKGDTVSYSPYIMQRRRDLYPPVTAEFADPSTFSPERWYSWQPRSWEFIPFNGGPRIVSDSLGLFVHSLIPPPFCHASMCVYLLIGICDR